MIQFFATFRHTEYLELAVTKLEAHEVRAIYAVPLDNRPEGEHVIDTMHGTDGTSLVDLGLILAMMFGTVGVSRGFVLAWGPVAWGLIGAAGGFALGFVIDIAANARKRKKERRAKTNMSEVVVVVQCGAEQASFVEKLLWEHRALGVAKTRVPSHTELNTPTV
ncbi:MAG TPA: hypothetical protein VEZ72_10935 [Paenibacillus sp.]|nr:hypothetical protein [Paenibacillus sp.]